MMIIFRVQRVSDSVDPTIKPLKHFLKREDAEDYVERMQPKNDKHAFFKKLTIEEVVVH